jgi:hypothetical protein
MNLTTKLGPQKHKNIKELYSSNSVFRHNYNHVQHRHKPKRCHDSYIHSSY